MVPSQCRHGSASAEVQWQALLRAIQRLNLTLFVHAQHDCVLGSVQVQPKRPRLSPKRVLRGTERTAEKGRRLIPRQPHAATVFGQVSKSLFVQVGWQRGCRALSPDWLKAHAKGRARTIISLFY